MSNFFEQGNNLESGTREVAPHLVFSENWLGRFPEGDARDTAQFLLDNITYISEPEFAKAIVSLALNIEDIISKEVFAMVFDQTGKSEKWIVDQVSESLSAKPLLYATIDQTAKDNTARSRLSQAIINNPSLKAILTLDDASYSGATLSKYTATVAQILRYYGLIKPMKFVVGAAYMTTFSRQRIRDRFNDEPNSDSLQLVIPESKIIPTLFEIVEAQFPDPEQRGEMEHNLSTVFNLNRQVNPGITLTYF